MNPRRRRHQRLRRTVRKRQARKLSRSQVTIYFQGIKIDSGFATGEFLEIK